MENPFDELKKVSQENESKFLQLIESEFPIGDSELINVAKILERNDFKFTQDSLKEKLENLVNRGLIEKEEGLFGDEYRLLKRKEQ